jgi:hypothetical protein
MILLRGRSFDSAGGTRGRSVAIVNELFAERHFAGQDPVGRQIRIDLAAGPGTTVPTPTADLPGDATWLTVIGIAPTIRQAAPGGPRPLIYLPQHSAPPLSAQGILRIATVSANTIAEIRRRVAAIDDRVVLANVRPLAQTLRNCGSNRVIATVSAFGVCCCSCLPSASMRSRPASGKERLNGLRPRRRSASTSHWLFLRRACAVVAGLVLGLAGARSRATATWP